MSNGLDNILLAEIMSDYPVSGLTWLLANEVVRVRAEVEHEREQSDEWTKTLDAIDALHTSYEDGTEQVCHECYGLWPCRTHSLLHPKEAT